MVREKHAMTSALAQEYFVGKRGRIRTYVFELAFGLGWPLIGLQYLAAPAATSAHSIIGVQVTPFDVLWNLGYIVGGWLIVWGVVWGRSRVRAAGLIILGTALLEQVAASVLTRGDLREGFYLVCAAACFSRAVLMVMVLKRFRDVTVDTALREEHVDAQGC